MEWSRYIGKFKDGDKLTDYPLLKTRLRCALNRAKDVKEVQHLHNFDILQPYRVYQFISTENLPVSEKLPYPPKCPGLPDFPDFSTNSTFPTFQNEDEEMLESKEVAIQPEFIFTLWYGFNRKLKVLSDIVIPSEGSFMWTSSVSDVLVRELKPSGLVEKQMPSLD